MNRAPRTLVIASSVILVAKTEGERTTLLVEQRPGKRDKPWRGVRNEDVDEHAARWALEHGISGLGLGPAVPLFDKLLKKTEETILQGLLKTKP